MNSTYIVTGGAGFIGSAFVAKLNSLGISNIIIVDDLGSSESWKNLRQKQFTDYIHKDRFLESSIFQDRIAAIIHMGACSSTTEENADYLMENNYRYTRTLAERCIARKIRFLYASSAATYGDGSLGFDDSDAITPKLSPINKYGFSKQILDQWALSTGAARSIVGLKFFNVFGPNEYHKESMRSVVCKAFESIQASGSVQLFRSHRNGYMDGDQKRDFVYVKDCVETMWWLLEHPKTNGIFNLGSGKARSWNDLVSAVFVALGKTPKIEYIDMPMHLRDQYQYFTEAKMEKLRATGCPPTPSSLEEGISDYVKNYLTQEKAHL